MGEPGDHGPDAQAAVCERYGPPEVVQIREVPKPVAADGEGLVEAFVTTVNSGDTRVRALRVPRGLGLLMRLKLGFSKPENSILGFEPAGRVEAGTTASARKIASPPPSQSQLAGISRYSNGPRGPCGGARSTSRPPTS